MMRMCDICGQVDDHPRHIHAAAVGEATTTQEVAKAAMRHILKLKDNGEALALAVAHMQDSTTRMAHMDCCVEAGCPDGSCSEIVATLPKGYVKGDALKEHLTSGKVNHVGHKLNEARMGTVLVEEATL